jgi:acetyl-CoA acyltransferase
MAAAVIRGLIEKTGVAAEDIEDIIVGTAFPEGEQGMNVARLIVLLADLPISVGGMTVNRFCGSSMSAVHIAAGQIQLGAGEVFVAAGIESMSRVPMGGFNPLFNVTLNEKNPGAYMGMGDTAENVARKWQITRDQQEEFAVASHHKAAAAQAAGKFADEIVPIHAGSSMIDQDGCIRPETTKAALAGLKLAFDQEGTVTAGTSSPLTDGASAVLVCSEDYAREKGLPTLARIRSVAVSGCEPEIMGVGPVRASRKALERAGLKATDMDVVELNEAFASQAIASMREIGFVPDHVNLDGGAIALGHPLGATGARIVGKAASLLRREGGRYAIATQCIGGGQGIATVLESV